MGREEWGKGEVVWRRKSGEYEGGFSFGCEKGDSLMKKGREGKGGDRVYDIGSGTIEKSERQEVSAGLWRKGLIPQLLERRNE